MSNITFDDLIGKQYLQSFTVEIAGVGTIELKELAAAEGYEIAKGHNMLASRADDCKDEQGRDSSELLELYIARHALSFVKKSPVTDSEVAAFRDNVGPKTISAIYNKGMSSAPAPMDLEKAEKNSEAIQS